MLYSFQLVHLQGCPSGTIQTRRTRCNLCSTEDGWPPSYHGTGSEECFNSGWCKFDRKAVSGFVSLRPGHPTVYSFHLNDAFQFQENIRVVEEQMGLGEGDTMIRNQNPIWGSTAYWYALPARPAESRQDLLPRQ